MDESAGYDGISPKPLEPFAALSATLAFFIMVFPIEADVVHALLTTDHLAIAAVVMASCYMMVFLPFVVSFRRQQRHPERWRGRGWLVFTGLILSYNLLFTLNVWTHFFRQTASTTD